jgi:plastocyanin
MRFHGITLMVSAAILGACGGGGEQQAADTSKVPPTTGTATPAPATGAPATAAPAAGGGTKIEATGQTHEVKMIGDDKGYRFEPANLTIKAGDAIRFTMVSGGPHNVAFDPATIPAESKAQLDANMDQKLSELSSPMLMNPDEKYVISFGGIKPGQYPYHCTPHLAMGMKGVITVQ